MKENIIEQAKKGSGVEAKLNLLREQLHHLILQETDRKKGFVSLCFVGGTALRLIFGLDRFSEDLDFSTAPDLKSPFELTPLVQSIEHSLEAFGFNCKTEKHKTVGAVQSCLFAFRELLHPVDPFFRSTQKLLIKFEVDTNPPKGAFDQTSPIASERLYKVRHYELSSLFAGKLHAVLFRLYTKGRDLYDFLWYVGRGAAVNKTLLENAIRQTQKTEVHLTDDTLQKMLKEKFEKTDFDQAKKDVTPFLLDPRSLELFEKNLFLDAASKVKLSASPNLAA